MNSITKLLDLEDSEIIITDIKIQGQTKTLTLTYFEDDDFQEEIHNELFLCIQQKSQMSYVDRLYRNSTQT